MKKLFIVIIALLFSCITCGAQVVREGNTFSVETKAKTSKKSEPIATNLSYKDKKGNVYPIYVTERGSVFVIKVSKKTGKEYRYYLPKEVKEEVLKELNK